MKFEFELKFLNDQGLRGNADKASRAEEAGNAGNASGAEDAWDAGDGGSPHAGPPKAVPACDAARDHQPQRSFYFALVRAARAKLTTSFWSIVAFALLSSLLTITNIGHS